MNRLFLISTAPEQDREVEDWLSRQTGELGLITRRWLTVLRHCGSDVREVLHDGHPTVCVGQAAFAYVNTFTAHVNVGFFHGAELDDPSLLLQGTGKFMRHVKLRPKDRVDARALALLIQSAYQDIKARLATEA